MKQIRFLTFFLVLQSLLGQSPLHGSADSSYSNDPDILMNSGSSPCVRLKDPANIICELTGFEDATKFRTNGQKWICLNLLNKKKSQNGAQYHYHGIPEIQTRGPLDDLLSNHIRAFNRLNHKLINPQTIYITTIFKIHGLLVLNIPSDLEIPDLYIGLVFGKKIHASQFKRLFSPYVDVTMLKQAYAFRISAQNKSKGVPAVIAYLKETFPNLFQSLSFINCLTESIGQEWYPYIIGTPTDTSDASDSVSGSSAVDPHLSQLVELQTLLNTERELNSSLRSEITELRASNAALMVQADQTAQELAQQITVNSQLRALNENLEATRNQPRRRRHRRRRTATADAQSEAPPPYTPQPQ